MPQTWIFRTYHINCDTIYLRCMAFLLFVLPFLFDQEIQFIEQSRIWVQHICGLQSDGWTSQYHDISGLHYIQFNFNKTDQCEQSAPSTYPLWPFNDVFNENCSVAYQFLLNNLWMNFEISTKWPTQNAFIVVCETIEWESGTMSKSAIFEGTFPQKHIYYDTKILVDHTQSFLNCALLFNWTCVVILKILILVRAIHFIIW